MRYLLPLLLLSFPALSQVDCDLIATRNLQAIEVEDSQHNHQSMVNLCRKGESYAKQGIERDEMDRTIEGLRKKTKDKVQLRKYSVIISGFYASLDEAGENYFDFNTQKSISKREVERREQLMSHCVDFANREVSKGISNGTIPMDVGWQGAFHSTYTQRCLNQSK